MAGLRQFRLISSTFAAGVIILVPMVITAQALWWLFSFIDNFSGPLAQRLFQRELPGLGFVTTLAVVFLIGLLFSRGPLRRLLDGFEDVIEHVPFVGVVYVTIKKVFVGFGDMQARQAFKRFVLTRLPGRTTPGFLTGSFTAREEGGSERLLCTVYIPTNHLWFGDIVVVPAEDVLETDLSVEDGISMILSAGAAAPEVISYCTTKSAKSTS